MVTVMRWLAQLARVISHPSELREDAPRFPFRLRSWCELAHNSAARPTVLQVTMVALRNLLLLLLSSTVLAVAPRAHFQVSSGCSA